MPKEHTYSVKGMHCASCEILLEKKLLEIPNVKSVDASTGGNRVTIEYEGQKPSLEHINSIFKKDNYAFFEDDLIPKTAAAGKPANPTLVAFNIAFAIIIAFLFLDRAGIAGFLNVSSTSSLAAFFGFGVLAGLSSCAALVGGIVLSMSKQWQGLYSHETSAYAKFQPHLMFNIGRVVSYALLGGVLGLVGSRLSLSWQFTSFLIIAISLFMVGLGLQMLGVKAFRRFQLAAPKFMTRYVADEKNFQGKHMPFAMGAATFFLPCGFTVIAQTMALLSGNALQGGLIMGAFALGTAPMLLIIGATSARLLSSQHWAERFSKAAGFLVLFFALFNISGQMSVLGVGFDRVLALNSSREQNQNAVLAPVVDGKQVMKMTVFSLSYNPASFTIKVGVPVRWEITASGQPGCAAGAVVVKGLLNKPAYLNPQQGQVTVVEFIPQKVGTYRFSCTMNMARGTITVVN